MSDIYKVATAFQAPDPTLRVRFGKVVSVETDRTMTVTIGGSTTSVSGVRYVASLCPLPGAVVILLTDGADLFGFAHVAAADRTLAPRAFRNTDQSIPDATDTVVTWQGVNSDAWNTWAAGSPTRLTAPVTGRYVASGAARFAANATGLRQIWISLNGTEQIRVNSAPAAAGSPTHLGITSAAFSMTKGDYIELAVRQNSGGALALVRDTDSMPSLGLRYLGP